MYYENSSLLGLKNKRVGYLSVSSLNNTGCLYLNSIALVSRCFAVVLSVVNWVTSMIMPRQIGIGNDLPMGREGVAINKIILFFKSFSLVVELSCNYQMLRVLIGPQPYGGRATNGATYNWAGRELLLTPQCLR